MQASVPGVYACAVVPGTIIRQSWTLYATHWRHLIPIAVVVYGLVTVLAILLSFLIGAFAALVTLAGVFWLQGVLVKSVEDLRDGHADLSLRQTVEAALPRINVLSASGFLAALAIGLGFFLLFIPGLVLLTIWSMIVPAIMLEGAGVFRAFGRSQELVRGNGWNVFAVIVITFALLLAASLVVSLALRPVDQNWISSLVVGIVANAVLAPFVAVAWTLTYYELRAARG